MPAKSLLEIATTACIKNIRELDSVGDYLLYKTIRPLLLKIDNPKQLRTIEINSPQIQGETGEIWLKIIKHEFPMEFKQKAYKPPNATKWYRVYEKYKSDHQKALDESEAKLKSAFMGIKKDREKTITKIVDDRRLLPQGGRVGPKKPWGFGPRDPNGSTLAFTRGSRTKTNNGASVMRKVRRETKEIASIHGSLSRPTQSSNAISKIRRAPPAMVNDYQRASQPAIRPPPPKPTPSEVVEAHEERAQYITDSDSDGGGGDDLFDDDASPPRQTLARPSSSTLKGPSPSPSKPAAKAKRGLLSNSYKGPKPQAAAAPSQPRSSRPVKEERRSPIPEREVLSPSPEAGPSSSPPPAARLPPAVNPRKRKGTDIFMKPKRRA